MKALTPEARSGTRCHMKPDAFQIRLEAVAALVERRLSAALGAPIDDTEPAPPPRLMDAMRHAVLTGGKRIRPFLLVETAGLFGSTGEGVVTAAAAVECLHCYSLVHDDLPAMDDDDLRRGRPTVHRAYDEATAILVGDGLQTLAFDLLTRTQVHHDPEVRIALVAELARASGVGGMVGGQMLDLAAEGRFGEGQPVALDEASIRRLQAMKTGALIRASCTMGAILGGAESAALRQVARYGDIIGLAFQLADDLLDVTSDTATLGKATAKDAGKGKGTLVGLLGVPAARSELSSLVDEAVSITASFGPAGEGLAAAARFVADRRS